MKEKILILCASLLFAGTLTSAADVVVEWQNPEDWSDFDNPSVSNEDAVRIYLPKLEEHLNKTANRLLPEGYQLKMVVSDIDMAGEYEPWQKANYGDVRIVRGIYPPKIRFTWELNNAEGELVLSGEEHLIDMGFDFRSRSFNNDVLYYEKQMLRDWLYSLKRDLSQASAEKEG